MNYEEFKTRILEEVKSRLTGEEQAYYEHADGNMLKDSLVIQNRDSQMKFGATFSSMYEVYNAGLSLEEMAERLVQENREKKKVKALQRVYMLENYENVKEDLYIRIVSQKKREQAQTRGIYRKIGDIILGVYFRIGEGNGKVYSMMVDRIFLDKWNLSKDIVLKLAMENAVKMDPPKFYNGFRMILSAVLGRGAGISIEEYCPTEAERKLGVCLSTDENTNGATAIFYPGVARRICEAYNTLAIYIVPTSVHEVVLHDCRYVGDVELLLKTQREIIEEFTPEDEVISNHIFVYKLETDEITEVM